MGSSKHGPGKATTAWRRLQIDGKPPRRAGTERGHLEMSPAELSFHLSGIACVPVVIGACVLANTKPREVHHFEVESNGDRWTVVSVDTKDNRFPVRDYANKYKALVHADRVNKKLGKRYGYWDPPKSLVVGIDRDRDTGVDPENNNRSADHPINPEKDPETNKICLGIDLITENWNRKSSRLRELFLTPEDVAKEIIQRYQRGYAISTIRKDLGCLTNVIITNLLTANNIPLRLGRYKNIQDARPDWQESFAKPTPAALYWAGFLMADGSVSPRKGEFSISCSLSIIDFKHVEALAAFVGKGAITNLKAQGRAMPSCGWRVYSDRIAADLARWGILPRKGRSDYTAPLGEATDSIDFWRGMIDGDGSVNFFQYGGKISLTGRRGICEAFVRFVCNNIDLTFSSPGVGLNVYKHTLGGGACSVNLSGDNAVRLANLLYGNAPEILCLSRKREKALKMVVQPSRSEWLSRKRQKKQELFEKSREIRERDQRKRDHENRERDQRKKDQRKREQKILEKAEKMLGRPGSEMYKPGWTRIAGKPVYVGSEIYKPEWTKIAGKLVNIGTGSGSGRYKPGWARIAGKPVYIGAAGADGATGPQVPKGDTGATGTDTVSKMHSRKRSGLEQRSDESWWEWANFKELLRYREKFGDCDVPRAWPDLSLVNYVKEQRQDYELGKLSSEQIQRLETIGFKFGPPK